jgi:O-antigen ligase
LPIWSISLDIIKDHPVTGVGARGFRYVYRDYADEQDLFIQNSESIGALYPHQIILEILVETGIIGLSCFIVSLFSLVWIWVVSEYKSKIIMLPYGLALLTVFFPLNTHYATYSSHWSALIFWCIALYCSSLNQCSDLRGII